jgi:hypothetical protein
VSDGPPPRATPPAFTYRWRLRKLHPERFGHLCRLVHDSKVMRRGPGARILVEFEDGLRVETVRLAIKVAGGLRVMSGSVMTVDRGVAAPVHVGKVNAP